MPHCRAAGPDSYLSAPNFQDPKIITSKLVAQIFQALRFLLQRLFLSSNLEQAQIFWQVLQLRVVEAERGEEGEEDEAGGKTGQRVAAQVKAPQVVEIFHNLGDFTQNVPGQIQLLSSTSSVNSSNSEL